MASDEDKREAIAKANSDLQYIMQEAGLNLESQFAIVQVHTTLRRFGAVADNRAGARTSATEDFAIDNQSPAGRAQVAAFVAAWQMSQEHATKESELRAEQKILGQPKTLQPQERMAMIKAVSDTYGKLSESEVPATAYLASKAEEVEQDEPSASPLDAILSRKDSASENITTTLDAAGHLRITRTKAKAEMPTNTEAYRKVMKVEANTWLALAARYKSKTWLQGLNDKSFRDFVEYVLGEHVAGIRVAQKGGGEWRPPWSAVMHFELKLRRECCRLIMEDGQSMDAALSLVQKDMRLKDLHFVTPLALSAMETPRKFSKGSQKGSRDVLHPKGGKHKGDSKGDAKGKSKVNMVSHWRGLELVSQTPDGRQICYNYNSAKGCDGSCGRVHVCRVKGCMQQHTVAEHSKAGGS